MVIEFDEPIDSSGRVSKVVVMLTIESRIEIFILFCQWLSVNLVNRL